MSESLTFSLGLNLKLRATAGRKSLASLLVLGGLGTSSSESEINADDVPTRRPGLGGIGDGWRGTD